MKYILIILQLSFIHNLSAQNSNGIITYTATINQPFENGKSTTSNTLNNLIDKNTSLAFELVFNKEVSLFKTYSKLDEDEISAKISKILLGGNKVYFYNLKTKESFYQIDAYGEFFIVETQSIEWNYSKETKQIGSYLCYKATSLHKVENSKGVFNHNVTAWFTTDIPINIGPIGYHGLPGLIIELQVQNKNYVVSKIELNPEEKIDIIKPKKGKRMTQKEFDELGKRIGFSRKQ